MLNYFKRTFWNELFHLKHCDYLANLAVRSPEHVCVCIVSWQGSEWHPRSCCLPEAVWFAWVISALATGDVVFFLSVLQKLYARGWEMGMRGDAWQEKSSQECEDVMKRLMYWTSGRGRCQQWNSFTSALLSAPGVCAFTFLYVHKYPRALSSYFFESFKEIIF